MASYPIPAWLSPEAAHGYGELAGAASRAAQSAQLQREQMAQESSRAAMQAQMEQQRLAQQAQQQQQQLAQAAKIHSDTLNQNLLVQSQKIAIDQAYKNSIIGLKAQDSDLKDKEFQEKTKQAAGRFAATQSFQKAILPPEQGGEGMAPQDAALKYMAPFMTPDAAGRMATIPAPFKIGAPEAIAGHPDLDALQTSRNGYKIIPKPPATATNAPTAVPITDENGQVIGHWAQPPGGGKPQRIAQTKTKNSGLEDALKAYQAQKSGGGKSIPDAPQNPKDRKKDTTYNTPKGALTWTGTGWVKP
jgi:hypothetical protein